MSGKKAKGIRAKTRHMYHPRHQLTVNALMQTFTEGDDVVFTTNGSIHGGMPHRRYKGKVGTITKKQGTAYYVATHLGNKPKTLLVASAHLTLHKKAGPEKAEAAL